MGFSIGFMYLGKMFDVSLAEFEKIELVLPQNDSAADVNEKPVLNFTAVLSETIQSNIETSLLLNSKLSDNSNKVSDSEVKNVLKSEDKSVFTSEEAINKLSSNVISNELNLNALSNQLNTIEKQYPTIKFYVKYDGENNITRAYNPVYKNKELFKVEENKQIDSKSNDKKKVNEKSKQDELLNNLRKNRLKASYKDYKENQ